MAAVGGPDAVDGVEEGAAAEGWGAARGVGYVVFWECVNKCLRDAEKAGWRFGRSSDVL